MEEKELCYCTFRPRIKFPLIKAEYRGLIIDILQLPPELLLEYLTKNRESFEELLAEATIPPNVEDK